MIGRTDSCVIRTTLSLKDSFIPFWGKAELTSRHPHPAREGCRLKWHRIAAKAEQNFAKGRFSFLVERDSARGFCGKETLKFYPLYEPD